MITIKIKDRCIKQLFDALVSDIDSKEGLNDKDDLRCLEIWIDAVRWCLITLGLLPKFEKFYKEKKDYVL